MTMYKFTIFFSWQSDLPDNRKIIRDAIKATCQKLKEDNGYVIEIDEATRNLPGAPKIEDSILEKIDVCDVFVCDITPITIHENKQYPNSNVVYELGYAMKALGDKLIILLAKSGNWTESQLPFDFNHRRIGKFSSAKDCNLDFEIKSCLEHFIKKGKCSNSIRYRREILGNKLKDIFSSIISSLSFHLKEKEVYKATEESTIMFARRMSIAYPGDRGVVIYTNRHKIIKSIAKLLQTPLEYKKGIEGATTDPIWWFRAGSAEHIKDFKILSNDKILINNDELRIKRIAIFRDSGRYYGQYVYVETVPDVSCGCYKHSKSIIKDFVTDIGYFNEEFALFKPCWYLPTFTISRQEYDDGVAKILGRHIAIKRRANLRIRYLSPYNFIIAAKFSPFNCIDFDRTSKEMFDLLLNNKISIDEFNQYMLKFPKKHW